MQRQVIWGAVAVQVWENQRIALLEFIYLINQGKTSSSPFLSALQAQNHRGLAITL